MRVINAWNDLPADAVDFTSLQLIVASCRSLQAPQFHLALLLSLAYCSPKPSENLYVYVLLDIVRRFFCWMLVHYVSL